MRQEPSLWQRLLDSVNASVVGLQRPLRILDIAGSLRRDSYNRAALRAARELIPKDTQIVFFDLGGIPVFNQGSEVSLPPAVLEFKRRIRAADALLFSMPEYKASVPEVLRY